MLKRLAPVLLGSTFSLAALAVHSAPVTVFSDDFEDGNVSDWTVSSSPGVITPVVTTRSDSVHGGNHALWAYFDAPDGGTGANYVHASHSFTAAADGDYVIDLWARSSPCSGCTMHFDVLVDGVFLARDGSAPNAYEFRTFTRTLTAGVHTLTLGMYTDAAASGRFNASFDDVRISTEVGAVPEPGSLLLAMLGLGLVGWRSRSTDQ